MKYEEAKKWCEEKGNGWRMPTFIELFKAYLDNVDGFKKGWYWSSTTYPQNANYAYIVHFGSGTAYHYFKTSASYVRCVR